MRAEVSALPWRPGAVSSQDRENEGMVCVCGGGGGGESLSVLQLLLFSANAAVKCVSLHSVT
jgi:hypothetical protein